MTEGSSIRATLIYELYSYCILLNLYCKLVTLPMDVITCYYQFNSETLIMHNSQTSINNSLLFHRRMK